MLYSKRIRARIGIKSMKRLLGAFESSDYKKVATVIDDNEE